MRRTFLTLAAAGMLAPIGLSAPAPALAEQPIDARAEVQSLIDRPINAALLYHRLWTIHDSRISVFNEAVLIEDIDFDNPEWAPDEALSQILEELQPYIRGLMAASTQPEADWGVEYSKGIEALLPHLGQLRGAERALRADARRLAAAGNHKDAAARIAALHRMSTQSRRDGILIATLVNGSMGERASMDSRILAVVYDIEQDARQELLRAIDSLPYEDRYGIDYAVSIEPAFFAGWIRREFTDERPGERLIEAMMVEDEAKAARIREMTRADLARELELFERFGARVASIWNDPDVFVKLSELDRELEAGRYGELATFMAPAFTRVRQQAERGERDLARARAALMGREDN